MSIFSKRAASVVFVGALSTFGGGIASAEEQGPADQPAKSAGAPAELEEIVVTARYRAESLQDTPISISALTANDLEARGITDVTGLTAVTPSTTLVKEGSTGGNTLVAYIRGLGQANYSLAFQPGVPIYVDDIYQPTAFGSMLTLGDIERVDVLRGPQGTLFGKNSEGGAVSIHQVDPKGDNSGYAEAGVGSYNDRRVRAAFDTSIIADTLFMRVAAGSENSDGYVTTYDYACVNPTNHGTLQAKSDNNCKIGTEGGLSDTYGRIAFKWLASDNVTARLQATTTRDRDETVPEVPLVINPNYPGSDLAAFNSKVAVPLTGVPINQSFINRESLFELRDVQQPVERTAVPEQQSADHLGHHRQARLAVAGPHDLHLDQWLSQPEWLDRRVQGWADSHQHGPEQHPLRVVQRGGPPERHQLRRQVRLDRGCLLLPRPGHRPVRRASRSEQVGGSVRTTASTRFFTTRPRTATNPSTCTACITLRTQLSFEAGVRYSNDKFNYAYQGVNVAQRAGQSPEAGGFLLVSALPSIPIEEKTSRVDPKVAVQYQWTQHFMTYAEYATGFKGAGTNPQPINAATATAVRGGEAEVV